MGCRCYMCGTTLFVSRIRRVLGPLVFGVCRMPPSRHSWAGVLLLLLFCMANVGSVVVVVCHAQLYHQIKIHKIHIRQSVIRQAWIELVDKERQQRHLKKKHARNIICRVLCVCVRVFLWVFIFFSVVGSIWCELCMHSIVYLLHANRCISTGWRECGTFHSYYVQLFGFFSLFLFHFQRIAKKYFN